MPSAACRAIGLASVLIRMISAWTSGGCLTSTVSSSDVGVRNSNGLMIELMRNFGVYFQFGETVGFVRWLSFNVDAGIGIQARVP